MIEIELAVGTMRSRRPRMRRLVNEGRPLKSRHAHAITKSANVPKEELFLSVSRSASRHTRGGPVVETQSTLVHPSQGTGGTWRHRRQRLPRECCDLCAAQPMWERARKQYQRVVPARAALHRCAESCAVARAECKVKALVRSCDGGGGSPLR